MSDIGKYIAKVALRSDLSLAEAEQVFGWIMQGTVDDTQIEELLLALHQKGEAIDEIAGGAKAVFAKANKIKAPEHAIDCCGTGGDGVNSLNISTAVAFVVAACGIPVAKHGNRAISSNSGSADVLLALGVNIDADHNIMERALNEIGICFMMAPKFHSAMRHVSNVRKKLKIRTIFNLLGPLLNPANVKYQLLGVYDKSLCLTMAQILKKLGTKTAWVVHGYGGMDELSITGKSYVASLTDGDIKEFTITPEDAGLETYKQESLKYLAGGDANYNADRLQKLLAGEQGIYRDIVLLNSAATLLVAGIVDTLKSGVELANKNIDNGKAQSTLRELVEFTN